MCGIVGVHDCLKKTDRAAVLAMSEAQQHRGPDDQGYYSHGAVHLAHRRLSLLDLSLAGHQPMQFGNLVIVFNGEIYNFADIKDELEAAGHVFTSGSDTEMILHAWQEWGTDAIVRFRGMFAFALYDECTNETWVYRDRVGVKPVYYYTEDGFTMFASELKALRAHAAFPQTVHREAIAYYLQLGYIPAPYTAYQGVHKLPPAHYLHVAADGTTSVHQYWSLNQVEKNHTLDEYNLTQELTDRLAESARLRMIADVPVGMFLSGGIDSSVMTALLVQEGFTDLQTFTIGFAEHTHNEATHAAAVAQHLGTKHHERICTANDAQRIIPRLARLFDEPFADASAIPTYLLAEFTKPHVTASLSADGGDELFGGYTRYKDTDRLFTWFSKLPSGLGWLFALLATVGRLLTVVKLRPPLFGHKCVRAREFYRARRDLRDFYAARNAYFSDHEVARMMQAPATPLGRLYRAMVSVWNSPIALFQRIDFRQYLPDDVLVKVDRATMAVSLEGREPLLDHTLIEFVASIPDTLLERDQGTKYWLRQVLYQYVPRELVDRPKQGFGVPLDEWLRGDLAPVLNEYLNEAAVQQAGLVEPRFVRAEVADFKAGRQPYNRVWNLLILHMWYKQVFS